ncbi:MAG TPA: ABC transporter ATP-binding protein [Thermoanaerobaculia bacterium]|jgi:ABC-2 type transport system ATP-binding protein|nr:ABC transporter ATP-binding protein [Thermoanaerobaculia bacterium]
MDTPAIADAVITLQGFGVRLGKRWILQELNAELKGRSIGLLGPNGAGKTTLIHTLLGFHKVDAGSARMLGHDVARERRQLAAQVGYMPERDAFVAGMTGIHFVRLMGELAGLPPQVALERAHEALFFVGLGEARYRTVDTYSQGMKQMAKLAQALVHGPRLLFLDEPTNGLDPGARQRMLDLVKTIRDRGETRIVLSSHLLKDVETVCDEVVVLKAGRIATVCDLEAERRANQSFLELELRGGNGHFAEAAARLGCECLVHNKRRLKLLLPPQVGVRDLYAIAAEQGVQIRRLQARRDSLEDIFLKAMEERDGSP